jgi:hypothetical protein
LSRKVEEFTLFISSSPWCFALYGYHCIFQICKKFTISWDLWTHPKFHSYSLCALATRKPSLSSKHVSL